MTRIHFVISIRTMIQRVVAGCIFSPLRFFERQYQKKYHLQFAHAKKLFFFDMSLLASALLLIVTSVYWFCYDPTVTGLVSLTITASPEKIKSGEHITYDVSYQNNSDVSLTNATVRFLFPSGFVPDDTTAPLLSLGTVLPEEQGTYRIGGYMYASPDQATSFQAILEYTQEQGTVVERKRVSHITIARDATVVAAIDCPSQIAARSTATCSFLLENTGDQPVHDVRVALPATDMYTLTTASSTNSFVIPILQPYEQYTVDAILTTDIEDASIDKLSFTITPSVLVQHTQIPLKTVTYAIDVVHPNVVLTTHWDTDSAAHPGDTRTLSIILKNTGDSTLHNIHVRIPIIDSIISPLAIDVANAGVRSDGQLLLTSATYPQLATLSRGASLEIPVVVPILQYPSGSDALSLALTVDVEASLPDSGDVLVRKSTKTASLPIGTSLTVDSIARYYTPEGDQLGRGPLPPRVGKETKYWVLVNIKNGTNNIQEVVFTATLPAHVSWTGKQSVTHGAHVQYNPATRQLRWVAPSLFSHEKAGIYVELSITPDASFVGKTPVLLSQGSLSAYDAHIQESITRTIASVDTSLPFDAIARQIGVIVQP